MKYVRACMGSPFGQIRYWTTKLAVIECHKNIHRLSCSLCILTICNFRYFPFLFLGLDFGSDCFSSWSLHTFYFYNGESAVSAFFRPILIDSLSYLQITKTYMKPWMCSKFRPDPTKLAGNEDKS